MLCLAVGPGDLWCSGLDPVLAGFVHTAVDFAGKLDGSGTRADVGNDRL